MVREPPRAVSAAEAVAFGSLDLNFLALAVALGDVVRFSKDVPIQALVPEVEFIKNKKYYGLNPRVPVVRLGGNDHPLIRNTAYSHGE